MRPASLNLRPSRHVPTAVSRGQIPNTLRGSSGAKESCQLEAFPWMKEMGNTLHLSDEYANRIPNPKHMPKYTKAKVSRIQDKHTSAKQLCGATLLLPLPYKKPCCHWASQSMFPSLTTDWLPVPLRTRHKDALSSPDTGTDPGLLKRRCFWEIDGSLYGSPRPNIWFMSLGSPPLWTPILNPRFCYCDIKGICFSFQGPHSGWRFKSASLDSLSTKRNSRNGT